MSTIHLNVDLDYSELLRVADMLQRMAKALDPAPEVTEHGGVVAKIEDDKDPGAPDAAAVFGGGPAAPATSETGEATIADPKLDTGYVPTVELDSEGLPWDERIHGGKRDKLAKTQAWKKRRCPKELDAHSWAAKVVEVEAELRAAMAAGKPPETVTPAGPAGPASPTKPAAPAAPTKTDTPDPEAMTFGQFLNATTTAGIDKATVTAACKKQGLPGLPLLATRPDLIPAVMAELFPGL